MARRCNRQAYANGHTLTLLAAHKHRRLHLQGKLLDAEQTQTQTLWNRCSIAVDVEGFEAGLQLRLRHALAPVYAPQPQELAL